MSPRKYSMGKRAQAVARTRARIVEAAMALYQEQPVESTSMQEVARRADVAPATVLNHFATPEELAEAVVEELVRVLRAPSPEIFEGADTTAERVKVLARALANFFERAEPWFHVHEREHQRVAAFGRGAREFDERVLALIRGALGDPGAGGREITVARALLSPPVFRGMRVRDGLTADGAADLVAEVLMSWLHSHSKAEAGT